MAEEAESVTRTREVGARQAGGWGGPSGGWWFDPEGGKKSDEDGLLPQGLLQRVEALERKMGFHQGDVPSPSKEYPHPNLKVETLEFGHNTGLIDKSGMQILASNLEDTYPAIIFASEFLDEYPTDHYPHGVIEGTIQDNPGQSDITLASKGKLNQYAWVRTHSIADSNNELVEIEIRGAASQGTVTLYIAGLSVAEAVPTLLLENVVLQWDGRTDDPASAALEDGMGWYRSDTDKFRGRAAGATDNFAMESYVDDAIAGVSGAMQVTGSGYQTYPSAADSTTVTGAAGAWGNGSYAQIVASTGAAVYLVGVQVIKGAVSEGELDIATGGAGSESVKTTVPIPWGGGTSDIQAWFPYPIAVATSTRIAARLRSDVGGSEVVQVKLIYVNQSDLVAL